MCEDVAPAPVHDLGLRSGYPLPASAPAAASQGLGSTSKCNDAEMDVSLSCSMVRSGSEKGVFKNVHVLEIYI